MLVMKFGGASVKDAAGVRNLGNIVARYTAEPLLVVVSAMDKTTNHLENLARLAQTGQEKAAREQLARIENFHTEAARALFGEDSGVEARIQPFFKEIRRIVEGILLLEEFPPRTYDRIVAYGELLSTTLVAAYLESALGDCIWFDARKLVRTDATWKRAQVIWTRTEAAISEEIRPILRAGRVVVTQGFIGSTLDGHTTTLGREGSDYSAAIFANCLDAREMAVWKDVPGILNADPRIRDNTQKLDHLSYEEAVEMTFYGATVIHPNTIKPLFNKKIPLWVRSFVDPDGRGSCISTEAAHKPIATYIRKARQVLIHIRPKDFSFMDEPQLREIFASADLGGLRLNLIQTSAISLYLCTDARPEVEEFAARLIDRYVVERVPDLTLNTVLNYTPDDETAAQKARLVQREGRKLFFVG